MARPVNLKTKIFLDGGDPEETKEVLNLLGFLDGQTTNPTLIAKNLETAQMLIKGEKFTEEELLNFYKSVVKEISGLISDGSVSVEVYSDANTKADVMLAQGKKMFGWIPNAHVKFPTNKEGLIAAEQASKEGLRVNMTLVFSQQQAAAVYAATKSGNNVFVSPFVGRLDDQGKNGMDLIKNIIKMYQNSNHHVQVLTASVRSLNHFLYAIALGSDIITAPFKILREWANNGLQMPDENFVYNSDHLKEIPYEELDLNKDWHEFDISHELTDLGIGKFAYDWNALIKT